MIFNKSSCYLSCTHSMQVFGKIFLLFYFIAVMTIASDERNTSHKKTKIRSCGLIVKY